MVITRVLNNNTVLTTDSSGEIVLLGAGLGFKRKPGDMVDEAKIEKQFVLKSKTNLSSFERLAEKIPGEYILLAEKLISYAKTLHDLELNESIHIALADHIHSAVENYREGITITNSLTLDLRQFYPKEFDIAVRGLELIREEFEARLPLDEAGFIAMHFVNAETENAGTTAKKILTLMQQIHLLVVDNLQIEPDKTSYTYYRYMTHLKYLAQRILQNYHFKEDNMGVLDAVPARYQREYACSKAVAWFIEENYGYKVGYDEVLYMTVHLAHLVHS